MKITKKEVEYVAGLARLGINREEKEKFAEELSVILEFVDNLSQVKTGKIEPTAQVTGLENVTREDRGVARNKRETEKLLDAAPETKDEFVKVKAVL